MSKAKTRSKKIKLIAESRRAYGIPAWVILRTGGRVRISRRRRSWRRTKIGL